VLRQREIATLTTPSDLARQAARQAQKPPTVSQQTMKELQAMRRAEDANRAARRAAAPKAEPAPQEAQPQAPTPQPAAPPPPEVAVEKPALPTPVAPKPAPAQPLAESPRPQPTRPNFATTQNAGDAIQRAARDAMQNHSGSGSGTMQGPARGGPAQLGNGYEVLSDTQGVNFDPYLKRILTMIRNNWIPLLPEETQPPISKQGITQIRFIILPNGQIGGIFPEASTRDEALDRAAWGSITGVGQFPPLPAEFHGPNLELRLRYFVNRPPQ
jgi:outer membrane biosynthesis protein TonB